MGGNYQKSVYNQLMEITEKLNAMEAEHRWDRKDIGTLTSEVKSLRKENALLREEVSGLRQKNAALEEKNARLEIENRLLRDDNERMKRTINNDSSNSSTPPSKDQFGKAPNTFNGRKPICRGFARSCSSVCADIEQELLNSHEICTDATPVKTDGKQTYIRNFSTERCVLYCSSEKKDLETLEGFEVLNEFAGTFTHDHEYPNLNKIQTFPAVTCF